MRRAARVWRERSLRAIPETGSRDASGLRSLLAALAAAALTACAAVAVHLLLVRRWRSALADVESGEADAAADALVLELEASARWTAVILFALVFAVAAGARQVARMVAAIEAERLSASARLAAEAAHELRAPIAVIVGHLSRRLPVTDPRVAALLAAVDGEARRCRNLVDDLLAISRPHTELRAVALRPLCEEAIARVREDMPQGPRVELLGAATAVADARKIGRVVFNLVRNAAEAAGRAGAVSVRIASAGGAVRIAVSDTGPGIAPEAESRLFEPFFTTKPQGTGLGLAASRNIAREHGGDVDVRSGPAGAVVTLRLPLA